MVNQDHGDHPLANSGCCNAAVSANARADFGPPFFYFPLRPPRILVWIASASGRVWKVLSLVAVLGFLGLGIWWMFSLPMVGEGGIFLALDATLMPLFWEKIGVVGKMSWVAMLFLLLAVEYRAIDKEHKDYTEKEKTARREERESFDKVLGKQQAGVKDILHQQEQDVKDILKQEQRHFERTLARLITSHRQEERDFSSLLTRIVVSEAAGNDRLCEWPFTARRQRDTILGISWVR